MVRLLLALVLIVALLAAAAHGDVACDGVDDLLTTGLALANFVTDSEFTVMVWLKLGSPITTQSHCYEGAVVTQDQDAYLALGRRNNTQLCGQMSGDGDILEGAAASGWHHVALTLGSGTVSLLVDGSVVTSMPQASLINVAGVVSVCGAASSVVFSPDTVASVHYYASAVPLAEVETLAKSRIRGSGRTTPSARWDFDCAEGASANGVGFPDRSGNARLLTGNDGANNTGLLCRGSEWLSLPWGPH